MRENVIQINGANIDVSVKNIIYVKKIISGILVHIYGKWKIFSKYYGWFSNYVWWSCKETVRKNFNENTTTCKTQNFACIFINYYTIIDGCYYLPLSDETSSKIKTFVTISQHK